MQTKFFTPLFLLIASTCFISSCAKQESMPGTSERQAETSVRSAQNSIIDSLKGDWFLRKVEKITIDKRTTPWKIDTVTTLYDEGKYIVEYRDNELGVEICEVQGAYIQIPFTYQSAGEHFIVMTEQPPGHHAYSFGVRFPNRNPNRVRLTEVIRGKYTTEKLIWRMERDSR